jgi:hypothetical protein
MLCFVGKKQNSVEEPFTSSGSTKTRNSVVTAHFALKLVVVRQLFVWDGMLARRLPHNEARPGKLTLFDIPQRVDDDPLSAVNSNNLRCTVGHAAVVDESGNTTLLSRINNAAFIDPEEVAAPDTTLRILDLPQICNLLSDLFADILDNHFTSLYPLQRVQTPIVDCRPGEFDRLLPFLELIEP